MNKPCSGSDDDKETLKRHALQMNIEAIMKRKAFGGGFCSGWGSNRDGTGDGYGKPDGRYFDSDGGEWSGEGNADGWGNTDGIDFGIGIASGGGGFEATGSGFGDGHCSGSADDQSGIDEGCGNCSGSGLGDGSGYGDGQPHHLDEYEWLLTE